MKSPVRATHGGALRSTGTLRERVRDGKDRHAAGFGQRSCNQLQAGREMRRKKLNRKAYHDTHHHTVDLVMHIGGVWIRAGIAGARAVVGGQLQPDQRRVQ